MKKRLDNNITFVVICRERIGEPAKGPEQPWHPPPKPPARRYDPMQNIPLDAVKLTFRQRRAIPLILAEKSIETGCRSAGVPAKRVARSRPSTAGSPPAPPPRPPGCPGLCPQDEGDDGRGCPDRRAGADRRAEGRGETMKGLGSSSIGREGRSMPEKPKNCHLLSLSVTLRTPENATFP